MKISEILFFKYSDIFQTLSFKCYSSEKGMGHFYNNMLCAYVSLFNFNSKKVQKSSNTAEIVN